MMSFAMEEGQSTHVAMLATSAVNGSGTHRIVLPGCWCDNWQAAQQADGSDASTSIHSTASGMLALYEHRELMPVRFRHIALINKKSRIETNN